MLTFPACKAGFGVPKLNENICAQIERAAHLFRAVAAKAINSRPVGRGGVPNRPDRQEFVDTAASLEALVDSSRYAGDTGECRAGLLDPEPLHPVAHCAKRDAEQLGGRRAVVARLFERLV